MSRQEITLTRHYQAIVAVPLLREAAEVVAVMSVDCSTSGQFDALVAATEAGRTNAAPFEAIRQVCEALLNEEDD